MFSTSTPVRGVESNNTSYASGYEGMITSPQLPIILQPVGLPHDTHGVTGNQGEQISIQITTAESPLACSSDLQRTRSRRSRSPAVTNYQESKRTPRSKRKCMECTPCKVDKDCENCDFCKDKKNLVGKTN